MTNNIIRTEMSAEEIATMKRTVSIIHYAPYEMGFMAGKLSALTDILNNSSLFNGTVKLGEDVGAEGQSSKAVPSDLEGEEKPWNWRTGDGSREDKASD